MKGRKQGRKCKQLLRFKRLPALLDEEMKRKKKEEQPKPLQAVDAVSGE